MSFSQRAVSFSCVTLVHGALVWIMLDQRAVAPVVDSTEALFTQPLIARVLFERAASESADVAALVYSAEVVSPIAIEVRPPAPIEAIATDSFEHARPMADASDAAEVERLQGIYRGQLLARLARLLEMHGGVPRATGGECTVNVVQNERGDVLDVMTDLCGLSQEQQATIASVIRRA